MATDFHKHLAKHGITGTPKPYASDTVRSDTVKKPIAYGRTPEEASKRMLDSVSRSKTEKEKNMVDSQGKPLDDTIIGILRGGSGIIKPNTPKVPAPKPKPAPTRKFKPLGTTPRGKNRGER